MLPEQRKRFSWESIVIVITLALLGNALASRTILTEEMHSCVYELKESIIGNRTNLHKINTENCGTLYLSDSFAGLWFGTTAIVHDLEPGRTYDFRAKKRLPFYGNDSWFINKAMFAEDH